MAQCVTDVACLCAAVRMDSSHRSDRARVGMLHCVCACAHAHVSACVPLSYSQPGLPMIKERTKQLHAIKNKWWRD